MTAAAPAKGERIAKVMARAGLCSRREAERWIAEGRVAIDGKALTSPAVTVTAENAVTVDGKPLRPPERPRLFRFHKPHGVLTTASDPEGRRTIYDGMPAGLPRLMPVGRLDFTSEGLLLLTNDGAIKRHLELPATGWVRRYRVRVFGVPDAAAFARLAKGLVIDGVAYGPIEAHLDRARSESAYGRNTWITMALTEGKNREVRRVCEYLGFPVNRLIRVAYGPFQLGDLPAGRIEEVPTKVLRDQLGVTLAGAPLGAAARKAQRERGR
ncbi:MAG: rRNA pseudouridine synthase [Rhodospirillales bacterium]|nr:rRNA pseudouridine synthase [Rhodospirillales bacterium]